MKKKKLNGFQTKQRNQQKKKKLNGFQTKQRNQQKKKKLNGFQLNKTMTINSPIKTRLIDEDNVEFTIGEPMVNKISIEEITHHHYLYIFRGISQQS